MKFLAAIAILLCATAPAPAQMFGNPGAQAWNPFAPPQSPHPAVVRVISPEGEGTMSLGSGTVVACTDQHALVITNWHVVRDAQAELTIVFPDGFRTPGTVLKVDRDWDLAAVGILRPAVAPVPLAASPPQPGEVLTIAGYGPGPYRSVSGRCLQFLSPAPNLPYDIIELAASARNGDSGGPILNSRGELAGVLFGEGGGATSGSHCDRVRWFLASLVAPPAEPSEQYASRPPSPPAKVQPPPISEASLSKPPEQPRTQWAAAPSTPAPAPWAAPAAQPVERDTAPPESTPAWPASAPWQAAAPETALPPANYAQVPPANELPAEDGGEGTPGWELLTGTSPFEKVKTFFAAIGAIALMMQLARQMKTE